MNTDDVLDALASADARRADWAAEVDALALQARADGCSWQEIGECLGITRQAAQQRFAPTVKAPFERQTERLPLDA